MEGISSLEEDVMSGVGLVDPFPHKAGKGVKPNVGVGGHCSGASARVALVEQFDAAKLLDQVGVPPHQIGL